MGTGKRYYWLRLKEDFFTSRRMKKLRKIAGGDCFVIIYLKLQLLSLKTEGHLYYEGLEESFSAELALDIDEDPENVNMTMQYLIHTGLAEMSSDGGELYLPWVTENTGSEGSSANRMRKYRQRETEKLESKTAVASLGDGKASLCDSTVTERKNESKREEIEKECNSADKPPQKRFSPPSVKEVEAYCAERNNGIDAQKFVNYYSSIGWKVGKHAMKDWQSAVRTWERNTKSEGSVKNYSPADYQNLGGDCF